jgi:hypothetical protein
MNSQLSYVICMLLADDALTLAELQTSHWLEIQSGWLRQSTMRTLDKDAEFVSSASRGMLGCKFSSRGVMVAATFNNKPMCERNNKEPADTQQQNSPSRVWCFINCRMLVCGQTETHKCVKKATAAIQQ